MGSSEGGQAVDWAERGDPGGQLLFVRPLLPRYSNSLVSSTNEDNQISSNEQNDDFETIADGFLDFTETNPFGDPNEA